MYKLDEHTPSNFLVWLGLQNTHLFVRVKVWATHQRTTDYYFLFSAIVTFPNPIRSRVGPPTDRSLIPGRCKILSISPNCQACFLFYTWTDNTVHKLATMCLPWQHWTKSLSMVWCWHSVSQLVVVDLWQSFLLIGIYYCLRVFWCAATRMSELEF
jgi:hypothetical protein